MITNLTLAQYSPLNQIKTHLPLKQVSDLVRKVSSIAYPYFLSGCAFFLCGQGLIELLGEKKTIPNDFKSKSKTLLGNDYIPVHGSLLIGAGLGSGLEALNGFKFINLGAFLKAIQSISSIAFLYANVFALDENITLYETLSQAYSSTPEKSSKLYWQLESAYCGILRNLGYIFATTIAMFGTWTAVAFLIGVVSACFGGLKIMCDFIAMRHEIDGNSLLKA